MKKIVLSVVLFTYLICLLPLPVMASSDSRRISATSTVRASGEKRVALVIGNSAYRDKPLRNPVNDARLIGQVVQEAGFELYGGKVHEDLSYAQMMETVEGFGNTLSAGGAALVFYAGHGMQSGGSNYLIPVDASIRGENELSYKTVNAGLLLAKMEQARSSVNIVVLDACRDNPFARSFRSAAGGLAAMQAPAGTLVAYSTGPGSVAEDGSGKNSIYSESLANALKQKGITIEEAFKQVRSQVRKKTGSKQTPWENTSLEGSFIFIETSGPVTVQQGAEVNHAGAVELQYWQSAEKSNTASAYRAYLKKYPNGEFAELAKEKLQALEGVSAATAAASRAEQERLAREQAEAQRRAQAAEERAAAERRASEERSRAEVAERARAEVASRPAPVAPVVASSSRGFTDPTTGMEFVSVPGGCFQMGDTFGDGDSDEKPVHEVCLGNFMMGKYEVTKGQWQKTMGEKHFDGGNCEDDNCPVMSVKSSEDVQEFILKLNQQSGKTYRLPTEAEWEYACRSGGKNEKYCGSNNPDEVAWHSQNSGSLFSKPGPHPVGQKEPNGLSIYDMSGNVWELTSDLYEKDYYAKSPKDNPKGPSSGSNRIVARGGGSYRSGTPSDVRASGRSYNALQIKINMGFRLVAPVQ